MKKIILCLFSIILLSACNIGNYDGLTAEEWASEADDWERKYNQLRSCVEDYDSFDLNEKKEWGGVFYYCE